MCRDPAENTASYNLSIVVMGSCLAKAQLFLACLLAIIKQRMFLLAIVA
jgi:hypothetical protein